MPLVAVGGAAPRTIFLHDVEVDDALPGVQISGGHEEADDEGARQRRVHQGDAPRGRGGAAHLGQRLGLPVDELSDEHVPVDRPGEPRRCQRFVGFTP